MKGTHKFVIGSIVLAARTLPLRAASFAYLAANRDDTPPRKPLPAAASR